MIITIALQCTKLNAMMLMSKVIFFRLKEQKAQGNNIYYINDSIQFNSIQKKEKENKFTNNFFLI